MQPSSGARKTGNTPNCRQLLVWRFQGPRGRTYDIVDRQLPIMSGPSNRTGGRNLHEPHTEAAVRLGGTAPRLGLKTPFHRGGSCGLHVAARCALQPCRTLPEAPSALARLSHPEHLPLLYGGQRTSLSGQPSAPTEGPTTGGEAPTTDSFYEAACMPAVPLLHPLQRICTAASRARRRVVPTPCAKLAALPSHEACGERPTARQLAKTASLLR